MWEKEKTRQLTALIVGVCRHFDEQTPGKDGRAHNEKRKSRINERFSGQLTSTMSTLKINRAAVQIFSSEMPNKKEHIKAIQKTMNTKGSPTVVEKCKLPRPKGLEMKTKSHKLNAMDSVESIFSTKIIGFPVMTQTYASAAEVGSATHIHITTEGAEIPKGYILKHLLASARKINRLGDSLKVDEGTQLGIELSIITKEPEQLKHATPILGSNATALKTEPLSEKIIKNSQPLVLRNYVEDAIKTFQRIREVLSDRTKKSLMMSSSSVVIKTHDDRHSRKF